MKKFVCTTTINPPTEAINRWAKMHDWELVVTGDLKTPKDYRLPRGIYLSPDDQARMYPALSEAIGWNCIQRRNISLLYAYDHGADIVAIVDDDNIPIDSSWGKNLLVGESIEVNFYETSLPAFDPIGATNYRHLWHRGFPPQLLHQRDYSVKSKKIIDSVDIQADFWNGDPDIDAFCRMEHRPSCTFDDTYFPIASNKMAPFNSQNTFMKASALVDYFLFPQIGRMDDIWAAYYMQAKGYSVVYNKASVFQDRNVHDLTKDMVMEFLGYEKTLALVQALSENPDAILDFIPESARRAFLEYKKCIQNSPRSGIK